MLADSSSDPFCFYSDINTVIKTLLKVMQIFDILKDSFRVATLQNA